MKQFVCMKWGSLYGSEYVNRLYAMVRANTTGLIRFVCMTDDSEGIRSEVEVMPCPEIAVPESHRNRPWRKVSLFAGSDRLLGLEGYWLFLDLDLVVTGDLNSFFDYSPDEPFVVMVNWTQPGKGIGNTSCYRFLVGSATELLEELEADHERIFTKFPNSQTYISKTIRQKAFWPAPWCRLFKVDCVPPWPMRYWQKPILPEGSRVVAFPGNPNPPDAAAGRWPEKRPWKRVYKYVRPATWVERIWIESESSLRQRP
jgi:hypothetical protein